MHIGLFSTILGWRGGPAIVDRETINRLALVDRVNRYTIFVVTPRAMEDLEVASPNFEVRVVKPGGKWLGVAMGMTRELIRRPVDLFHATFVPPPIAPAKLIVTMTCWSQYSEPEVYPPLIRWRLQFLLNRGVKKATAVFCYTGFLKERVIERFGFDPERVFVTKPGLGPEMKAIEDRGKLDRFLRGQGIERPYILFIGTLTVRKNVHRLIRAFHRLVQEAGIPHQLVLLGERGFLSDEIFETIETLKIADRIALPGRRPLAELPLFYTGADVFCVPTISEGFGLPPLEAMACGTPVVASNVTSVPEVVGDAGLLIDPHDVDEIADALLKVISDETLRDDLIRKGFANAARHSWENMAKQMVTAYETIAAAGW